MENCKAKLIGKIERFLADDKLMEEQRQTLQAFDRFNELEAQCRLSTRHSYLQTLRELGVCVQKLTDESLYYVFVNLRENDTPEYFVVDSKTVSGYVTRTHKLFLDAGGGESKIRALPNPYEEFDLDKYKDNWELLESG